MIIWKEEKNISMPIIKPSGVKRCQAVSDIIESVALQ